MSSDTVWKEIDQRYNDGLTVTLEWNSQTGETKVYVVDTKSKQDYEIPVASDKAMDAFHHPFSYVG